MQANNKLTMVAVYCNGKRKTLFMHLPIVNGQPVLTDAMLHKHFGELNIRRGDTFTVG